MKDHELIETINKSIKKYKGDITILQSAIGVLCTGRAVGWKPLYLMHNRRTLKKYEEILGVEFQEALDEEGLLADKSVVWAALGKVKRFWKAVREGVPDVDKPTQFG